MNLPAPDLPYDALLVVSFGGPECRDDVIPFLENVLRGKPVPRERLLEVAGHYYHFDGVSPINQQCRELIAALQQELNAHGIHLPVFWGNRNWHPYLTDTVRQMRQSGVQRALAYVTSGFSCYSGCRQYRENLQQALAQPEANGLQIDKLRVFYNHPDFIAALTDRVQSAILQLQKLTAADPASRTNWQLVFTAHSIPRSMADSSDYVRQLRETCRLVAGSLGVMPEQWDLVYQSRSGRPEDPWLEPDVLDHLATLSERGVRGVVISPVGFLSDHMEVLYDLDDEAGKLCQRLGLQMVRAATPGHHPKFVTMIRKLIEERLFGAHRECVGLYGPNHDVCPPDCCPAPIPYRRPATSTPHHS